LEKDASNSCDPGNISRNTNASLLARYLPKTIEKDVFEQIGVRDVPYQWAKENYPYGPASVKRWGRN